MIGGCDCPDRAFGVHDATCTEQPDAQIIPFPLPAPEDPYEVRMVIYGRSQLAVAELVADALTMAHIRHDSTIEVQAR